MFHTRQNENFLIPSYHKPILPKVQTSFFGN